MSQMMLLMWTYMLIFSILMMLILTSFLYFFFVPLSNLHRRNMKIPTWWQTNKKILWNWMW